MVGDDIGWVNKSKVGLFVFSKCGNCLVLAVIHRIKGDRIKNFDFSKLFGYAKV